jgi:hypothetical protein
MKVTKRTKAFIELEDDERENLVELLSYIGEDELRKLKYDGETARQLGTFSAELYEKLSDGNSRN